MDADRLADALLTAPVGAGVVVVAARAGLGLAGLTDPVTVSALTAAVRHVRHRGLDVAKPRPFGTPPGVPDRPPGRHAPTHAHGRWGRDPARARRPRASARPVRPHRHRARPGPACRQGFCIAQSWGEASMGQVLTHPPGRSGIGDPRHDELPTDAAEPGPAPPTAAPVVARDGRTRSRARRHRRRTTRRHPPGHPCFPVALSPSRKAPT